MSKPFPFLRLPLELREQVYSHYFHPAAHLRECEYFGGGQYKFDFDLYQASKQVHREARRVFRRENILVRIETPWPQAGMSFMWQSGVYPAINHISHEGLCPIVAAHEAADALHHYHALVQISAPAHLIAPAHSVVVLLEDLHLFCNVWYYSALNYETLNHHLRVAFTLKDPNRPNDAPTVPKPVPVALQRRMLLPFGQVKELDGVEVHGYDDSVKRELEATMKIPYNSPRKCCEDAAALMEQGDRILGDGKGQEALDTYIKAFHAIHILIAGRTRRVLADQFFHKAITEGRYSGQTGTTVRIILRIMLVSRVVNAYLKLQQFEDATYWGMRSLKIMRSTVGTEFENFLIEVAGMLDVGLLYLRTGISLKKMEDSGSDELKFYADDDDVGNSNACFKLAKRFLKGPHQKLVKKELDDYKLKVPDDVFLQECDTRSDVDSMAHMHHDEAAAEDDNPWLTPIP